MSEPLEQPQSSDDEISHEHASSSPTISFVIPTYNEEPTLEELRDQIGRVCEANSIVHEIIFVDDGSADDSWSKILSLSNHDCSVAGIRLRRNFGKAAALSAGIAHASNDLIITMDADLQDDPKEIPRFLQKLDEGYEVVSGWKKVRHDPWHKTMPSLVFNGLVSWLTGVKLHDHNCGFKAYQREVFNDLILYGERHRFIPVLAAAKGWRIAEIDVQHHPRKFGQSKYGISRLLKGFLDLLSVHLLTGYAGRPLHLIGSIGMLFFALGGLGMTYLTVMRFVSHRIESMDNLHLHETAIFYYCILAILLGAQFLTTGLLSELIVSRTSAAQLFFAIADSTGFANPADRRESQEVPS